ncbi:MAG: hypothetical protein H7Y17_15025 [Chlorobia bacterium]|nr:hypothetical protein [Fimbriimonadaceae bacterium]
MAKPVFDIKVPLRYQIKDTKIEVIGVCKITEDGGQCWNPQGVIDKALTSSTLARFGKGGDLGQTPLPVVYGKKNRIVLTRIRTSTSKFEPRLQLCMASYREVEMHRQNPQLDLTPLNPVVRDLYYVTSELRDTISSLYALVTEPVGQSPNLALVEGATIQFDGLQVKVVEINPVGDSWTIELQLTGKVKPRRRLVATVLDSNGKTIEQVDSAGRPVTNEFVKNSLREFQQTLTENPDNLRPPPLFNTGKPGVDSQTDSKVIFSTYTNPKHIGSMYLAGSKVWTIEVTGIPLDPIKKR